MSHISRMCWRMSSGRPSSGRFRSPASLEKPGFWAPAFWVARAELRADSRLADLEVFRQPQGSNPSYLSVAQFAALRDHCTAPVVARVEEA